MHLFILNLYEIKHAYLCMYDRFLKFSPFKEDKICEMKMWKCFYAKTKKWEESKSKAFIGIVVDNLLNVSILDLVPFVIAIEPRDLFSKRVPTNYWRGGGRRGRGLVVLGGLVRVYAQIPLTHWQALGNVNWVSQVEKVLV